ncbi:arginine decarboxylase [Edwardsiella ictaluri]|uniref:arginine decarboxylase n=1 Tax=Edwardsiella ictaluri TaxID=67780 RepID=UPI0009BEE899|nr:arginine decarboxylase [Edwardsiella ictaluri]ARD40106.1 arginine decarboxylase [Edwardsiella ictaluri]QPW25646.1 arginine decarboxylase [Edwardsiella ictaluri]
MCDKKYLIVGNNAVANTTLKASIDKLASSLMNTGECTQFAYSFEHAATYATSTAAIDCVMIEWAPEQKENIVEFLQQLRIRHEKVPVFLLVSSPADNAAVTPDVMSQVSETFLILDDTTDFIVGRLQAAVARYERLITPPLMTAMMKYAKEKEYSWSAPGHQGGIGFCKTPIGRKFFDFYGENIFRTDMGIERASLGSMLDHTGAFGESEKYIAKVFGADRSYSLVVGTSGANRTIMQACCTENDIAICDRNSHKSIEQGLILTGTRPVYMTPSRNAYGIIGPIAKRWMQPQAIAESIATNTFARQAPNPKPMYSIVTNCTYDGLIYNGDTIQFLLGQSCDRIHYDEAWFGYSRFNPIYRGFHAMRGDNLQHTADQPTIFATHSTHKLLNALSQASYIHVREGRGNVKPAQFNQAYMIHATTSPLYSIAASNDVAAAMMDGEQGINLTSEVIEEAVDFRQAVAKAHYEAEQNNDWFFKPWNPEVVTDPDTGEHYDFADAPKSLLTKNQSCWILNPQDEWHGFNDLDENWVMLDPVKVSLLTPGLNQDGTLQNEGIPATLVTAYLSSLGIVPTRTTDFQIMFLFSMGVTKGKWVTLMNSLMAFKKHYDADAALTEVLPNLVASAPDIYTGMTLRQLGHQMIDFLKTHTPSEKLNRAYSTLPQMDLLPREAYMQMVHDNVEMVSIFNLAGRTAANSVIPYPPGIPMLMSGENFGAEDSSQIGYLKALQAWDETFPGFEHETEGTEKEQGVYHVMCVKQ